jgi:hypothetical protein
MKTKSILFSLFFISLSFVGFAQETASAPVEKPKAKIWYGPRFGLDIANFTTNVNSITDQLKSNYQAGLMVQFGQKLYLQPEVYYAAKKSIVAGGADSTYIKVPVFLGLRIFDIGLISLHIMGGPQFVFPFEKSNFDKNNKIADGMMPISWQVGAGVDVLGFITADLRYTMQDGKAISDQAKSIATAGLNLTVGLKFR